MKYNCIHVKSMLQLRQFLKLKGQIWDELGYEMEYPSPQAKLLIFKEHITDEEKVLGTLELIPFIHMDKLKKLTFLSYPQLIQRTTIFIVGFGILASHRNLLESFLIRHIVNDSEKNGITHAAAFVTEENLTCIRKQYRIPYQIVAAPISKNGQQLYPVLFNLEFVYMHKHHSRFNWLSE